MTIEQFLSSVQQRPEDITFAQTMAIISANFDYKPARFTNGPDITNEAGTNEGSCKIFAFAKLYQLDEEQTLSCFGEIYRDEVLALPDANNHGNIRAFMKSGWNGINFDETVLKNK